MTRVVHIQGGPSIKLAVSTSWHAAENAPKQGKFTKSMQYTAIRHLKAYRFKIEAVLLWVC